MKKIAIYLLSIVFFSSLHAQKSIIDYYENRAGEKRNHISYKPVSPGHKLLEGSIVCNSFYFPDSAGVILYFTLEVISTDYEYGDSVAMTFPAGMTPTAGSLLNGVEHHPVDGQTISWGINSDWGDFIPGIYNFSVTVNTGPGLNGDQTAEYYVSGDDYGEPPNFFEGSYLIHKVPPYPVLSVNTDSVNFGRKALGTSNYSGDIFVITNLGLGTLSLENISNLDQTNFSVNIDDQMELSNGDTAYFSFSYSPVTEETDEAVFTVTTQNNDSASIHLKGKGCDAIFVEDFELWLPGWTILSVPESEEDEEWHQADDYNNPGNHYAEILYDSDLLLQDEWLISPTISIPPCESDTIIKLSFFWMGSLYWSVDPYDNYDINIMVSTDGGENWPDTIWVEDDSVLVINSGVDWPWDSYIAYVSRINITEYQGQNINIAFQYIGLDGAQFILDSITVYDFVIPANPDLVVKGYHNSQYTIVPVEQVQEYDFSAKVKNLGADLVNTTFVNVNIEEDSTYTGIGNIILPLNYENSTYVSIIPGYEPETVMDHTVTFSAVLSSDVDPGNNNDTLVISVSDSVYARDNGIPTGALGFGEGSEGTLGQIFQLFEEDTLTSVSVYLTGSQTAGEILSVDIYDFEYTPVNIITSTVEYTLTYETGWVTLPLLCGGALLPPGKYFVGVNETEIGYLSIGTTESNFFPNTGWVSFAGNPWATNESYALDLTYLLRANLAKNPVITELEVAFSASTDTVYLFDSGQVDFTDISTGYPDSWHWNFDDGGTSTEQNPSHIYFEPGAYNVELTAYIGVTCSDFFTKKIYVIAASNIENEQIDELIKIFPNPAFDDINIVNAGNADVFVYNIMGELLISKTDAANHFSIDVRSLPAGMYLIKIITNDRIITKKITVIN